MDHKLSSTQNTNEKRTKELFHSVFSLPISFLPLAPPAGPECSRNFTSNSGVIKSPGFPEKYPNNLDCTFMIFAPKMSEIILEFESFELEPDPTPPAGVFCRYDRLEIWDGFPGGKQSSKQCPATYESKTMVSRLQSCFLVNC